MFAAAYVPQGTASRKKLITKMAAILGMLQKVQVHARRRMSNKLLRSSLADDIHRAKCAVPN